MLCEISTRSGVTLVAIRAARLDASRALELKTEVTRAARTGHGELVLDLRQVEMMDSTALGAMVGILRHLGPTARLKLVVAHGPVADLLHLTRMDRVFALFDGVEAAIGPSRT